MPITDPYLNDLRKLELARALGNHILERYYALKIASHLGPKPRSVQKALIPFLN